MPLPDDLQKLYDLREKGALSEDEFAAAKKRLLDADDIRTQCEKPASALNQLRRSLTDRWLGGVCGGLGAMTGIPAWSWRILFVLTAFLHGLGVVMYVLLWIFVPVETVVRQPVTPSKE
jgi:phage shock protein PspC (stress-responsive transcriptional regulator)